MLRKGYYDSLRNEALSAVGETMEEYLMVVANHERLQRCLIDTRDGIRSFCEQTWEGFYGDSWLRTVNSKLKHPERVPSTDDLSFLLKAVNSTWHDIWRYQFGQAERNLVSELVGVRNRHSHNKTFSTDDTYRALDTAERLLGAFGAKHHQTKIRKQREDLLRQRYEEQARAEHRKIMSKPTETDPQAGLACWREVISPHEDVAAGRFAKAQFAADLYDVWAGDASEEYQNPLAFFRRTFLTAGLAKLLTGAAERLAGRGGEPVVELQTNFGGGKTHSLIALYHLASGADLSEAPEVAEMLAEAGVRMPRKVNRAVFVGQSMSPTGLAPKSDGTEVNTIWGEIAYQLGGVDGYRLVADDDRAATNPGAKMRELFKRHGPALILIDEWVAYARQLPDNPNRVRLPGGDFDTQFTFAQALTEAAAAAGNVVVMVAVPASDVEVGGEQGREALVRLRNVLSRSAAQWQPATADESFEIVRRRLFDPIGHESARVRDGVVRSFMDWYRPKPGKQRHTHRVFPSEVYNQPRHYEQRMRLSYPIHPELFDRLFVDWSSLPKFQRTRGALRLMAEVVSDLWSRSDGSLMIMPGTLPMDCDAVVAELKKYLEDGWDPVIRSDVDGPNSLPLKLDRANRFFGRISATRRTARAVYLGSAPRPATNRGVDIKRVALGCAQPGESPGQFADALRRLSNDATHLYVDGSQYWYALQANVTRLAAERAESDFDDEEAVDEIRGRLLFKPSDRKPFVGVHVFPETNGDVPDTDEGVRLVILPPDAAHVIKASESPATKAAERILLHRSAGERLNRNLLVFVAAHSTLTNDLIAAARAYLGWRSVAADAETLDLTPQQKRQAETKLQESDKTLDLRIQDTFVKVLTPRQVPGTPRIEWQPSTIRGEGTLPARVFGTLQSEERMIDGYAGVRVRLDLDGRTLRGSSASLWTDRGDIRVGDLWALYARFPYMPRLAGFGVLAAAIGNGTASLDWQKETFAYAEAQDGESWSGVSSCRRTNPARDGFLVRPDVLPDHPPGQDNNKTDPGTAPETAMPGLGSDADGHDKTDQAHRSVKGAAHGGSQGRARSPERFHSRFVLDPVRGISELDEIMEHVTNHLEQAGVKLVLEIEAESSEGFDDRTRRIVIENATQLGAESASISSA